MVSSFDALMFVSDFHHSRLCEMNKAFGNFERRLRRLEHRLRRFKKGIKKIFLICVLNLLNLRFYLSPKILSSSKAKNTKLAKNYIQAMLFKHGYETGFIG